MIILDDMIIRDDVNTKWCEWVGKIVKVVRYGVEEKDC